LSSVLSGIKIAVIGGDDRELILIAELVKMGATVAVAGFPREMVGHGAFVVNSLVEACKEAEVAILPLPGTNPQGVVRAVYAENSLVLTEEVIGLMAVYAISNQSTQRIGKGRPDSNGYALLHGYLNSPGMNYFRAFAGHLAYLVISYIID
jgi:hypothetical protein